jgi:hypothetical protein
MSSIAPTLLVKKIENCLTSGPPIFDVVSGSFVAMEIMALSQAYLYCPAASAQRAELFRCRAPNCKCKLHSLSAALSTAAIEEKSFC